jgi:ADP-heptose:LPS heptosyltransferase
VSIRPAGNNVLVIKLGALGDVILSLPQLSHILEVHAKDRVTLLTAPDYVELVSGFAQLQVVCFRRRGVLEMSRLLGWLLARRFDVVYDLQGSLRSRIMTQLTQAQKRAGPSPGIAYTHVPPGGSAAVHAFDRFNEVLVAGGIGAAAPVYRLPWKHTGQSAVDAWLGEHDLQGKRLALLHAGGSPRWASKRWGEAAFQELAAGLIARGIGVVWIGARAESDLNRRLSMVAGTDATDRFGYSELVALAGRALFAVTGDSAPMHLLSMTGLPVYAFFGPTDWRRSHALGQGGRVLTNPVECSPCYRPVCPPQHRHACLQGISPAQVLARLEADGLVRSEGSK